MSMPSGSGDGAARARLTTRAPQDVLFRSPAGAITVAQFLGTAQRVAAVLPAEAPVLNLCQERAPFAAGFAAALLRGTLSLLPSDRSPEQVAALARQHPGAVALLDAPPERVLPLPHIVMPAWQGGAPSGDNPDIAAQRVVAVVYTSGSTGAPAAHRKCWGALAARSAAAAAAFGFAGGPASQIVSTVPPQHMYGFETTVLLPLHASVTTWCGPGFYPADVAAALAAVPAPRVLVTTPLQLRALVESGLALPPLAGVISATAPLSPALAARAEAAWDAPVREIFGATEVGSIASRRTVGGDIWNLYDGVALDGDPPVVSAPFAARQVLADVVEKLDDRSFRLLGRQSDMIKLAGKRASLEALNRILTSVEGVIDGVFIAPPDTAHQPMARLTVYAVAPNRSAEAVLAALRMRVDPAFLPRRVLLVDRLPRNEMGKLQRQALADWSAPMQPEPAL